MIWYSRSVSVWIGATVIESPVCTPIGSRFSIEQMTTQLSARSRMTSISNSFQPSSDSSMSTSLTGERSRPRVDDFLELLAVVGDAAAGAAEREGGADDEREGADLLGHLARLLHRVGDAGARQVEPDLEHGLLEQQAVLALVDGLGVGADHPDAVLLQHAGS